MFETMRKVFGPVAVTVIIGAIALVFIFYGVFNPRSTRGTGEGALAATVNGDSISMQEFSRQYQQRMDFYQGMMKGKADPNLLRQLGIGRQVVEELVRNKLLLQQADKMGMTVADEEVRDKIKELPYFKDKDGKFDVKRYEGVLAANRYSPSAFEDMIREDLMRSHVVEFMRGRAKVSEQEVLDEFKMGEDRRQVEYVALTPETAKKTIAVSDKEVDDFLKSDAGLKETKTHYERTKMTYAKQQPKAVKKAKEAAVPQFQSFDEVKRKVAVDLLRDRRTDEATKYNRELAKELFEKAKAGQFKAFAKAKGLDVKTSEKFNRLQNFVPGLGEMPDLVTDAFKEPSPLVQGPKLYETGRVFAVAQNLQAFKPDLNNFAKQKSQLLQTASARKEQGLFEQWMSDLRSQAKVSINKAIENPEDGAAPAGVGSAPVMED